MAMILESFVTGTFQGRAVAVQITFPNKEPGDMAKAAYVAIAGKALNLRRRDWHFGGNTKGGYSMRLYDGKGAIEGDLRFSKARPFDADADSFVRANGWTRRELDGHWINAAFPDIVSSCPRNIIEDCYTTTAPKTATPAFMVRVGDIVNCPSDRGDSAYAARVESVGTEEHKNVNGAAYRWISTRRLSDNRSAVWPSNRLTLRS